MVSYIHFPRDLEVFVSIESGSICNRLCVIHSKFVNVSNLETPVVDPELCKDGDVSWQKGEENRSEAMCRHVI